MGWFCKRRIIYGCEETGNASSPYLTRYEIFKSRFGNLYLHIFHRSDGSDMHDHPWSYRSLILWRGYVEETPTGRRRKWPGMLLCRDATHVHRVELVGGKPAVTLVWVGRKVREWGFHCPAGWERWREYFVRLGC